ncbi:MAG TPA: anti-sigma factor antagonist [Candidatus Eremiobacteraceae bacterium]|nr:anti-sigma factor antagonist [Candidatus Eremiobacteraceae bacterium]
MTDQASFSMRTQAGALIMEVVGEVDIVNAADLRSAMSDAASHNGGAFVLTLDRLAYFDSQTLEILVELWKRLNLARRMMVIVAGRTTAARRLLDVSAISSVIPTLDTVDEALAAVSSPNP